MKLAKATIYFAALALSACQSTKLQPLQRLSLINKGHTISVKIEGYCPVNLYKDLFAVNASYQIQNGVIQADSDADGIPDVKENADLGLNAYSIDSNEDGYSDLFIQLTGMTLSAQARLPVALNAGLDSDSDGLWDSDEQILDTDMLNFDSDGDEIPDGLEVRFGASAKDNSDAFLSPAGDGLTNLEKIKRNLPLRETATAELKALGFQYQATTDENGCHHFVVSNISVLSLPTGNQLRFYFIEQKPDGKQALVTRSMFVPGQSEDGAVFTYHFEEGTAG